MIFKCLKRLNSPFSFLRFKRFAFGLTFAFVWSFYANVLYADPPESEQIPEVAEEKASQVESKSDIAAPLETGSEENGFTSQSVNQPISQPDSTADAFREILKLDDSESFNQIAENEVLADEFQEGEISDQSIFNALQLLEETAAKDIGEISDSLATQLDEFEQQNRQFEGEDVPREFADSKNRENSPTNDLLSEDNLQSVEDVADSILEESDIAPEIDEQDLIEDPGDDIEDVEEELEPEEEIGEEVEPEEPEPPADGQGGD